MKPKSWFKPKAYTHLTKKLTQNDGKWIKNYVSNPENIKRHRFYPLIHRTLATKRFKESIAKTGGPVKRHYTYDNGIKRSNVKHREIYYPNHLDSHIYAFYTQKILEPKYEKILRGNPQLNQSVIAYRRIPLADKSRCKCNIDFANEAFEEIKQSKGEVAVLALDISKFFDSLDHIQLKKAWIRLLDKKNEKTGKPQTDLDKDHYNIYKSLVQFAYVEMEDMLKEFGYKHPNELIQEEVYFLVQTGSEFRDRIKSKGYLKRNPFRPKKLDKNEDKEKKPIGIPQGTPISAFLANLYLLEFDKKVLSLIINCKGLYRRYSDDILIICPKENFRAIEESIYQLIKEYKLEIQSSKTQRSFYINGKLAKGQKPINYLGFQFDGHKKRLKSASIAKFYRKMKSHVKFRAYRAYLAKKKLETGKMKDATLHRKRLYLAFTHLGTSKANKKKRSYFSYANFASRVMHSPAIRSQLSNAWKILHKEIDRLESNYSLPQIKSRTHK